MEAQEHVRNSSVPAGHGTTEGPGTPEQLPAAQPSSESWPMGQHDPYGLSQTSSAFQLWQTLFCYPSFTADSIDPPMSNLFGCLQQK